MPKIRELLHKKDKIADAKTYDDDAPQLPTFIRSDTNTFEIINPPSFHSPPPIESTNEPDLEVTRQSRLSIFKPRSRKNSEVSPTSPSTPTSSSRPSSEKSQKRRSILQPFRRECASSRVPENLPDIAAITSADCGEEGEGAEWKVEKEAQWEERATILAQQNERELEARLTTHIGSALTRGHPTSPLSVSSPGADDNIQEAIRLHEAGDLKRSTSMFGRLADPDGENSALSQVLYGLALRHGWGIKPDTELAIKYLSAAATNAATIEDLALQAGMKKGGSAKGELVLAIFELANCFRQGWGVPKDPVAAKQYYETAANLGDTDAMNEVGWCYLEGFGCKKDKLAAAKYYRLSETSGNRTLGNSWIWKAKYDPK